MSDKTPKDEIKSLMEAAFKVTNGIPPMNPIVPNQGGGGMPPNMNDLTAADADDNDKPPPGEPPNPDDIDPGGEIPMEHHPWMDYWWGPPPRGPFAPGGKWRTLWENSSKGAQSQRGGWIVL